MNYIDYGIMLIMVLSIYSSYRKGLVLSLLAISGWYLAIYISHKNSIAFNWLQTQITTYLTDLIPQIIIVPATSLLILLVTLLVLRISLKLIGLIMFIARFKANLATSLLASISGVAYGVMILCSIEEWGLPIIENVMTLHNSWLVNYLNTNFPVAAEHLNAIKDFIIETRLINSTEHMQNPQV